ncbi:phytanoyl-CoA dioxygenase, peroxisomal [Patella vulgata]|uniref:phytanoyl-CoA dioxygenase, peroxisomal n=1 Tax=Patella vulgata TaxID=6465 RepID=UPI0024A8A25C|nr:phytanoyl-CoA dioxygenase, peroxisomal [Patella vulgata]
MVLIRSRHLTLDMAEKTKFLGLIDKVYPDVFNLCPPDVNERKPGQLPYSEIQKFYDEGYIVVKDFFTPEELEPCRQAIEGMVEQLAQKLYKAGKIKHLYSEYGLFQRLTKLEEEHPGSNILLFKYQKIPKSFRDIWSNDRMLNLLEQILGPDVAGHPTWNLRTKTPKSEAVNIPWHQDSGYFSWESYDHLIATAWIPFLDAVPENGCMQMAKNGHKSGKVAKHTCCVGPTWYIQLEEEEMAKTLGVNLEKDVKIEPVPYGGFILFHNLTPHRSLINVSNDIRWSVDLRWQSPHYDMGFYNIGDGIVFRSKNDPQLKPDWDKFLSVDRKVMWQKTHMVDYDPNDEFDSRLTGPWIGKWEIVNHNRHTQAFKFTQ